MCAPTLRSRRSRASTAKGPGWRPRNGSSPESSPRPCGTAPASDPRLATPEARRPHCSGRCLTSIPRAPDRWPRVRLGVRSVWSVCGVFAWKYDARWSPDGQRPLLSDPLKGTPAGDHHFKFFMRIGPTPALLPQSTTQNLSPGSHPGVSSLRANRLWNTTTISKNAPRMTFSQKELS